MIIFYIRYLRGNNVVTLVNTCARKLQISSNTLFLCIYSSLIVSIRIHTCVCECVAIMFRLLWIQFGFLMYRRAFIVQQTRIHAYIYIIAEVCHLFTANDVHEAGQDGLLMETNRPETTEEMETRNSINCL